MCVTILMLTSCNKAQKNSNTIAHDSNAEQVTEYLICRIEQLENEVTSLQEALTVEKNILNHNDTIFDAFDNMNGDNIYLGMDWDGEYITAVYIKIPKETNASPYEFLLLAGYETDGVPFLNCFIKPQYETAINMNTMELVRTNLK